MSADLAMQMRWIDNKISVPWVGARDEARSGALPWPGSDPAQARPGKFPGIAPHRLHG
jgi:hypothetical protein